MEKNVQRITEDMNALADDARALISATADMAEEKVAEARKRLAAALDGGRKLCGQVMEKSEAGAEAANQVVKDHPYQAIAVGVGVGALLGYLVTRRCSYCAA